MIDNNTIRSSQPRAQTPEQRRSAPHPISEPHGDLEGAAASIRGFSVQAVPRQYDLEFVAVTAVVFAAVGSPEQREWAYHTLAPHAGLHALVGGCAAYHGVVDHYLGILAAALGRTADALGHLGVAVALHERLGTVAWAELSHAELDRLRALAEPGEDTFRLVDGMWWLRFDGHDAHLPDAKGLRDIATLLAAPNRPVHVFTLLGRDAPATRADPMLDRRAVAEFRRRLADLDTEIDEADRWNDPHRAPAPNGTHSWQSCTPRADWPGGPAGSVTRPNVPAKP
jgi:hypothetical protein